MEVVKRGNTESINQQKRFRRRLTQRQETNM